MAVTIIGRLDVRRALRAPANLTSIPGWGVDVLDEARGRRGSRNALQRVGRIDVVISNAGRRCRSQMPVADAGRGLPSAVRKQAAPATCRSVRITRVRRRAHEHRYSG